MEKNEEVKAVEVFCSECGTKFKATSKMAHLCPACKAKREEQKKEYAKTYAKKRMEKLGLVSIQIYKDDREILKNMSTEKGITVAETVTEILKSIKEIKN